MHGILPRSRLAKCFRPLRCHSARGRRCKGNNPTNRCCNAAKEKVMRTNTPRTFQPTFESLEDRCLMATGLAAGLRVIPQLPTAQQAAVTAVHKPILVNGLGP